MKRILFLFFFISASHAWGQRQDAKGSKDYPLISRFEGFTIEYYKEIQFDRYLLPLGPSKDDKTFGKTMTLEGKITKINYRFFEEPKPSLFQVYKSYEKVFAEQSVEALYSCLEGECKSGGYDFIITASEQGMMLNSYMRFGNHGYQAVKLNKDGKDIYIAFYIRQDNNLMYELHFIEVEEMGTGNITMADIEKDIKEMGKKAFYGLYFDTGKSTLKDSSDEELALMANYLKENPNEKYFVVGHTDNVGNYESNMKLSIERANAIINALKEKHGLNVTNLQAVGVGPVSPIATNKSDEGKAKNRRVELVVR